MVDKKRFKQYHVVLKEGNYRREDYTLEFMFLQTRSDLTWLNMDSKQLRQKKFQERSEQAFTANPSVVHELKDAEIKRQFYLVESPDEVTAGMQQRPEPRRLGASRADRFAVLSCNKDHLQEFLAFFSRKTHFVIYERLEFVAPIEDSLDAHLLPLFC